MKTIKSLATRLLAALSLAALIAAPASANGLSAEDMAFAFGGKAPASARSMTTAEMEATEGAVLPVVVALGARIVITQAAKHGVKLLGPGPGGRICGVVCKNQNFGARIDFAKNPSPTKLHIHIGTLDKAKTVNGTKNNSWDWHRPITNPTKKY